MITGSWCLTEILKSRNPCSSNRPASHSADSTSASGVALPYLASNRLSSEPALTPIRNETPASVAAWAISLTWSSKALMLPGFTRTAAQPASIAANTYLGWKWMSAMTGIWLLRAMAGSAAASSALGTATRTMSQPAAVNSAICCRVELMSAVSVVVIDWTLIGASPPTSTLPTLILRDLRRGASVSGGIAGSPRSIVISVRHSSHSSEQGDRVDQVGQDEHDAADRDHRTYNIGDRQHLRCVGMPGVGPAEQAGQPSLDALVQGADDVAAIQRHQRYEVEQGQEQVDRAEQQEHLRGLGGEVDDVGGRDLAGDPAGADDAHRPVDVPGLAGDQVRGGVVHLHREPDDRAHRLFRHRPHLAERRDRAALDQDLPRGDAEE